MFIYRQDPLHVLTQNPSDTALNYGVGAQRMGHGAEAPIP